MMTEDEVRALLAAATPGPWFTSDVETDEYDRPFVCIGPDNNLVDITPDFPWSHEETIAEVFGAEHDAEANAALIAAAPYALESLLAQCDAYREWIRKLLK